jgi:hypothetical protein
MSHSRIWCQPANLGSPEDDTFSRLTSKRQSRNPARSALTARTQLQPLSFRGSPSGSERASFALHAGFEVIDDQRRLLLVMFMPSMTLREACAAVVLFFAS